MSCLCPVKPRLENLKRLKRQLLVLLWWVFIKPHTPIIAVSPVAMQVGKGYLPASLVWPRWCGRASGKRDCKWTQSHALSLMHTHTHTQEESLGYSPRDSHYSTRHTLPHSWQPLRVVYCGIERTAGLLVWRVKLSPGFCFLVVSACTLKQWHKERGFSKSTFRFHLSWSMLFSTLAVQDSEHVFMKLSVFLCQY